MASQTEYAYDYIKQRILDGSYKPAQRLVESQLAETIGVSRNTLKKALLKIEQDKLIVIEDNKGATIRSFSLQEVVSYLEIRECLEGLIAAKAACNMNEQQIEKLGRILAQMKVFMDHKQFDDYSKLNKEFHAAIYESSGNSQAVAMVNEIKTQLNRYRFRTVLIPGRSEQSYDEHARIYRTMVDHDPEQADKCMRAHIANVRQAIYDNFDLLFS